MSESIFLETIAKNAGQLTSIVVFILYLLYKDTASQKKDNKYAVLLEKVSISLTEIILRLKEHNDDHKEIINKVDKVRDTTARCPYNK